MALLVFSEELEIPRVEEIRVRIEGAEHAWNRALINGFIGDYRVGKVLLHYVVDLCEDLEAGPDIVFVGG
jgi:hypothetical protein